MPATPTLPSLGSSAPASSLSSVLLPQPEMSRSTTRRPPPARGPSETPPTEIRSARRRRRARRRSPAAPSDQSGPCSGSAGPAARAAAASGGPAAQGRGANLRPGTARRRGSYASDSPPRSRVRCMGGLPIPFRTGAEHAQHGHIAGRLVGPGVRIQLIHDPVALDRPFANARMLPDLVAARVDGEGSQGFRDRFQALLGPWPRPWLREPSANREDVLPRLRSEMAASPGQCGDSAGSPFPRCDRRLRRIFAPVDRIQERVELSIAGGLSSPHGRAGFVKHAGLVFQRRLPIRARGLTRAKFERHGRSALNLASTIRPSW